jgi:hypothetical protein
MIKKLKLSFLEIVLAMVGSITVWYLLANYALGGPLSTDSNSYIDLALNPAINTRVPNRYFHIFLMRPFLKLAPTPLTGFQDYWAFLIAATALMVYVNARSITTRSNFIHGLLAVGIFFSIPLFAQQAGMAGVDTAAMFMVMVMVTVFLASVHQRHQSKWLLAGLGFLFFLAFKTKETTLVTALLFIGLGFEDGRFHFKAFLNRMVYVVAGLLGGIVFFALLCWIMLGDPLFGWRLSNLRDFLSAYVGPTTAQSQTQAVSANWFTAYLLGAIYIPFILYLISGFQVHPEPEWGQKLVWWLPLAVVCFVSLFTSTSWGPNYIMAALPIISLLGPQFLELSLPEGHRERMKIGMITVLTLGAVLVIRLALRTLIPRMGWNSSLFYVGVYESFFLSIILAMTFLWKRSSASISALVAVLILALLVSPLASNARLMSKGENRAESSLVYYPYSAFAEEIHFTPSMKMFVSFGAWNILGVSVYCNTLDDVKDVFNAYFDASSKRSNFIVPYYLAVHATQAELDTAVTKSSFRYLLMSSTDWQAIPAGTRAALEQHYSLFKDKKGLLVFLQAK